MRASIFEHAGGEAAFQDLARAHHARCLADPELNHPFSRDDLDHVAWLAADVLRYAEPEDIPAAPPVPRWTWDGLSGSAWAQRRPSRRSPPEPRS